MTFLAIFYQRGDILDIGKARSLTIEEFSKIFKTKSKKAIRYYALNGGCYLFARIMNDKLGGNYSFLISEYRDHCALRINGKVYDYDGFHSIKNFKEMSESDLDWCEKNFPYSNC